MDVLVTPGQWDRAVWYTLAALAVAVLAVCAVALYQAAS